MAYTKFAIENSIAMKAIYCHLLQQVDFEDASVSQNMESRPCHIYMICSRPRITIDPASIKIDEDFYCARFVKHYPDHNESYDCKFPNTSGFCTFELSSARNRIKLFDKAGNILTDGKTSLIFCTCINEYDPVLDLKVLYVGQAFGKDGERLASDRLLSHSTLQAIYSDFQDKSPTEEVWIVMWQFKPYQISVMGAATAGAKIGIDESIVNYEKSQATPFPLDQQITVTEATLIKYFSPPYNVEYKTTFPASSHSSYEYCYRLDFNSACFELESKCLRAKLYSDSVKANFVHFANYFLHDEAERRDVLNVNSWEDSKNEYPQTS